MEQFHLRRKPHTNLAPSAGRVAKISGAKPNSAS